MFLYSQFETDNLQLSLPPDQSDKSTVDVLRQTMDTHKHLQVWLYLYTVYALTRKDK